MVKVLIGFDRQPGSDEEGIVCGAGGAIKYAYHLVPAIAASIPEAAIQGLLRNPRVISIESDITVYAIDAELENTWGVERIGTGIVYDGGNKGTFLDKLDDSLDYSATVVCTRTARTIWAKMEGYNRILSHRDIESSATKCTFHCIPLSISFGYFVSFHMNILLQVGHMCYGHELLANNLSQITN